MVAARRHRPSSSGLYGQIESYLNAVVEEYQHGRQDVVEGGGSLNVADLTSKDSSGRLYDFIFTTDNFGTNAGDHLDAIVKCLEEALREPVGLPRTTRADQDEEAPVRKPANTSTPANAFRPA